MSPSSYEGPSKHELIALVNRYNDYHRRDLLPLANVTTSDYRLAEQIRSNQRRAKANYSPIQVLAKELVEKIEHTFHLNNYSVKRPDQASMGAFQGKLADLRKFMKDFSEVNEQARRETGNNEGSRKHSRSDGHRTPPNTPLRATKATPASTNKHKAEGKHESGLFKKGKAVAKDWGFDVGYRKLRYEKERKEDEDRILRDAEYWRALEADQKKRQAKQKAEEDERIKKAKAHPQAKPGAERRNALSKENLMKLEIAQAGIAHHKKDPENTMKSPIKEQDIQAANGPKDPVQLQTVQRAKVEDLTPNLKVEAQVFRPERAPPCDQQAASIPRNSLYQNLAELKELERTRRPLAPRGYAGATEEDLARHMKYVAQAQKEAEKTKADQIKSGEKRDEVYENKVTEARVKGLAMASEVRRLDWDAESEAGPSAGP